jgi:aspartate aminotransferase-like enzyme
VLGLPRHYSPPSSSCRHPISVPAAVASRQAVNQHLQHSSTACTASQQAAARCVQKSRAAAGLALLPERTPNSSSSSTCAAAQHRRASRGWQWGCAICQHTHTDCTAAVRNPPASPAF